MIVGGVLWRAEGGGGYRELDSCKIILKVIRTILVIHHGE